MLTLTLLAAGRANLAPAPATAAQTGALPPAPAAPRPGTSYPLEAYAANGTVLAKSFCLPELGWTDEQLNAFLDGIRAAFHGPGYQTTEVSERLGLEIQRRVAAIRTRENQQAQLGSSPAQPEKLNQYLKDARKRYGMQQTESGLCYRLQAGRSGVRPGPEDIVVVTIKAMGPDGSTRIPSLSAENVSVRVDNIIPGLTEGLQMMAVEGEGMFVVPPSLSFGDGRWPESVERGSPLVFFVTLHAVVPADLPPESQK